MKVGLVDLKWDGHHTPYVVYLSRYFTEHGHDVTFVTRAENPRLDELPDSDRLDIEALEFADPHDTSPDSLLSSIREQRTRVRELRRIYETARNTDVDVVHLLYFDRTQVPLFFAAKLLPGELPPTVATLHRDAFLENSDRTLSKVATQGVARLALHATLKNGALDCLTVHANSIRDRIIGAVPAATRANTKTIPAPTPESSVDVSQQEAREYLDLPVDGPLYLFFGGLRYEKGSDLLAEALRSVGREMTVVLAGPEADFTQSDVDRWRQRVPTNVNLVDRIEFIPEENVDYYFVAADALVLPYRRTRGISGPLRRAAMVGTPIVATANSDIGSVVEQHSLGVNIDNPVQSGLSDWFNESAEGTTLASKEALSRFAESRHWRATGDALLDIFSEGI
jgi:glycosyltransferase involved in cell wall biosynthesis